ncbi:MAG: tail protein X [Pseudomonadota bacterium]|nr:tail protein X [Pseudomonadota bacterium]
MTQSVVTIQHDTVDQVCQRHLARTAGVTEQVMALNAHLANLPPVLPQGVLIRLPDIPAQAEKPMVQLWE